MSKWNDKIFGEVATTSKGRLTLQSESKDKDYLPLINTDAVNGNPSLYGYSKGAVLCEPNDVLMLWDGERSGLVAIGYSGVVGSTFAKLSPNDFIDSKYLFYFLDSKFYWIQGQRTGTGVPHVPKNLDKILWVKYPESKTEQQQIAKILSTADTVIEKTQAAIAKYKAIKQGMLQDLFTRGIDITTNKLRPPYEDAPHLYKESKLEMIPVEWDEIPLEELTTQIGDGIHTTPRYSQNTHFYFINGNNLINGEIQIRSALCVNKEEFEKHFLKLDEKTILYSINGTIGNIAFYKNEQVILGKSVCYISCKQDVNIDYIYFLLQTHQISKFFELELTASTIRNLSLASVRSTPITIPKNETEQNLIAERIKAINNKLEIEQTYLQKMQSLKKGLMEDLLSGKKKVNNLSC